MPCESGREKAARSRKKEEEEERTLITLCSTLRKKEAGREEARTRMKKKEKWRLFPPTFSLGIAASEFSSRCQPFVITIIKEKKSIRSFLVSPVHCVHYASCSSRRRSLVICVPPSMLLSSFYCYVCVWQQEKAKHVFGCEGQ